MGSYILTSQNLNNTVLRLPNETWIKLYGNERHCRDIDFSKTAPNAEKISIKGSHLNRKPIQLGSKVTEINLSEVKQNFEKTAIKKIDISNIRFNSRTCISVPSSAKIIIGESFYNLTSFEVVNGIIQICFSKNKTL